MEKLVLLTGLDHPASAREMLTLTKTPALLPRHRLSCVSHPIYMHPELLREGPFCRSVAELEGAHRLMALGLLSFMSLGSQS